MANVDFLKNETENINTALNRNYKTLLSFLLRMS
jgi:hypothetical protein